MFGTVRLPRRRIAEHARLVKELPRAVRDQWEVNSHIVSPQLDENMKATVVLAERLGDMPIVGGNAVETMTQTDAVIGRLIEDIDSAKKHVPSAVLRFRG